MDYVYCLNENLMFGRFYHLEKLGEGSYGKVYKVIDLKDRIVVALKVGRGTGLYKQRNIIEAEILERITESDPCLSRYVVKLKTWLEDGDNVVTAMELLSKSLKETIKEKQIKTFLKISIYAKQMVEFLYFMNQSCMVHGDIKPENILHDFYMDRIKFIDFGLCHTPTMQNKMKLIQTLSYRAPEVVLGYDYYTSADVWSVGCVLMECLLGYPLFNVSDEVELMRFMVRLLGTPDQYRIACAPKRDELFTYDKISRQWIVIGSNGPIPPIGLFDYIISRSYLIGNDQLSELTDLLDFVNRMLAIEPEFRISPEDCFDHPFFKMATSSGFGRIETRHLQNCWEGILS